MRRGRRYRCRMPIQTTRMTMELGHVHCGSVRLTMSVSVESDRTASLHLFMSDLSSRRDGEFMMLGYQGATELRELLQHAEQTIGRMIQAGQIVGMSPYR